MFICVLFFVSEHIEMDLGCSGIPMCPGSIGRSSGWLRKIGEEIGIEIGKVWKVALTPNVTEQKVYESEPSIKYPIDFSSIP